MLRYFSHICDGTDVQAGGRSCTYGRAPNAIDILQGSFMCPSYTDTWPPFLYGDSDNLPHLVAFYDTLGIRSTYSRLNPPVLTGLFLIGYWLFTLSFEDTYRDWPITGSSAFTTRWGYGGHILDLTPGPRGVISDWVLNFTLSFDPRKDAGGSNREYVLRIPSVS